jgi:prepilin-type N-terminal cleavage/methylation domain-containing protein
MKNNRKSAAFSLIELSIVILIIGILIAGVTQSSRLLTQARLNTAKTLTQSAPVSSIKNLVFWIETTSDSSFDEVEKENGLSITNWYDINPQASVKNHFAATTKPVYTDNSTGTATINNLPVLAFNGSSQFMTAPNFSNITSGAVTIFLVIRPTAALTAAQTLVSKRTAATVSNIHVGTTAAANWQFCDGSGTITCYTSTGAALAINTNYVLSATYASNVTYVASPLAVGNNFYLNGNGGTSTYQAVSTGTQGSASDVLHIGRSSGTSGQFFGGQIGEIIIYDRVLKSEERRAVEAYLGKKWNITVT